MTWKLIETCIAAIKTTFSNVTKTGLKVTKIVKNKE